MRELKSNDVLIIDDAFVVGNENTKHLYLIRLSVSYNQITLYWYLTYKTYLRCHYPSAFIGDIAFETTT